MNAQSPKTPGEAAGSKSEAASAKGFSRFFSVLQSEKSPPQQAIGPAREKAEAAGDEACPAELSAPEIAAGEVTEVLPKDGTALPTPAETGKVLPHGLPVAGHPASAPATPEAVSETSGSAATVKSNPAALADAQAKGDAAGEPAQHKIPASQVAAASTADRDPGPRIGTSVPTAGSSSPVPTAVAMPGMRSGGHPTGSEASAGEGQPQGGSRQSAEGRQDTLGVSLRVAPAAEEAVDLELARQPGSARRSIAELGIAAAGAQDGPTPGTPLVQASGEQSGTLSPTSAFASRLAQAAEPQDIARILDRLTAAREAVQPAAVAMAINHDEFGELSLRFDQLRTGQLSVQLSASSPEAQSALAAAASQQGGQAGAGDSSAGGQTQQHQQGQSAGRGAQAERDLQSGSGQSDRGERQKQGGNAQHQDAPSRQQRPRDGVFA